MKKGFYPKLAWDAVCKNRRMYFPYILTGSVMVMIFYILMSLLDSPDLQDIHGGSILTDILPFGCGVIGIFSILFLFYTNSFLIRRRYREFGLYNILGMDKRNIGRLMLWESMYTSGISIALGIICGAAFYKATELILLNILDAEISFNLSLNIRSMVTSALVYLGIYLLLLPSTVIKVGMSKPLELMQSSRVGEKRLKCNPLFALLGVALLAGAYYMAVSIEEPAKAMLMFFVAVVMVIVGTYLLFISGSVALCRLLRKNKKYYYRANHFVSVSQMAYRMKRNGAGLASICILLTMVLVMLSSTTTLYFGEEESIENRYPHDININVYFDTVDDMRDENLDKMRRFISPYAPDDTDLSGVRYAIAAGQFTNDGITLDYVNGTYADYDKIGYLYAVSLEDYNQMTGENKTLSDGECLIYSSRIETKWDTFTPEYGETYTVKERLTSFNEDSATLAMVNPNVYIVVGDISKFVSPVANRKNSFGYEMLEYKWILGFDCTDADAEARAYDGIDEAVFENAGDVRFANFQMDSREANRARFYEMYGSLFFLGIMLSVVFLMAAVLIIYYKQISEGYEDQSRFAIMQKVGMTKKDIRESINSQMLTVFFMPLCLAGIHLAFAFPFISKILLMFAFDNTVLNVCVTLICFAVFGVFYGIVYKITSGGYYAIVSEVN